MRSRLNRFLLLLILLLLWLRQPPKPLYITTYDPRLGGINCQHPCDQFASGQRIQPHDWHGYGSFTAAACPAGWLGRRLWVEGIGFLICKDRGGAIVETARWIHIDVLSAHPLPNGVTHRWWLL